MSKSKLTPKTPTDKNTVITRSKKGQFIKGNKEGNPKGRPKKGLAMTDILKEIGETKKGKKTRKRIILEKAYEMAESGDLKAIQFIVERIDGKALERFSINTSDAPFEIWQSKVKDAK